MCHKVSERFLTKNKSSEPNCLVRAKCGCDQKVVACIFELTCHQSRRTSKNREKKHKIHQNQNPGINQSSSTIRAPNSGEMADLWAFRRLGELLEPFFLPLPWAGCAVLKNVLKNVWRVSNEFKWFNWPLRCGPSPSLSPDHGLFPQIVMCQKERMYSRDLTRPQTPWNVSGKCVWYQQGW